MLDLQAPHFTQAAVLEILPDLPAKTLQNWLSRNIITLEEHNPGRQGKRLYTAYGIIVLSVMQRMADNKIGPSDARDMGFAVANRALEMSVDGFKPVNHGGVPFIVYPSDNYDQRKRHVMMSHEGRAFLSEIGTDIDSSNWKRTTYRKIYTVIETDFLVIDLINIIVRWIYGNPTKVKLVDNICQSGAAS